MVNQIFKNKVPIEEIKEYLINNCVKERGRYVFNNYCFKRIKLNNNLQPFLEKIKPYYHTSKQYYINRPINYTRFMTIIRQLCKLNNIVIESQIKYYNSTYETIYYFNFSNSNEVNND